MSAAIHVINVVIRRNYGQLIGKDAVVQEETFIAILLLFIHRITWRNFMIWEAVFLHIQILFRRIRLRRIVKG